MAWISLTSTNVRTRLSAPELSALGSAALASGQTSPLEEIISQVVREIRGFVAAYSGNTLGEAGTIPDECERAALALIRWSFINRLPGLESLASPVRESEKNDANSFLRDVAAGKVRIVPPADAAPEQAGGASTVVVTSSTRRATRSTLSGL